MPIQLSVSGKDPDERRQWWNAFLDIRPGRCASGNEVQTMRDPGGSQHGNSLGYVCEAVFALGARFIRTLSCLVMGARMARAVDLA